LDLGTSDGSVRRCRPRSRLDGPISVPTLALCGADDIRAKPMKSQSKYFSGPYRFEIVPDCGHFLHPEKPDAITRLVLGWLAGGQKSAGRQNPILPVSEGPRGRLIARG